MSVQTETDEKIMFTEKLNKTKRKTPKTPDHILRPCVSSFANLEGAGSAGSTLGVPGPVPGSSRGENRQSVSVPSRARGQMCLLALAMDPEEA